MRAPCPGNTGASLRLEKGKMMRYLLTEKAPWGNSWAYTGNVLSWARTVDSTHPEGRGMVSEFRDSVMCLDAPQKIPAGHKTQFGCIWLLYRNRGE